MRESIKQEHEAEKRHRLTMGAQEFTLFILIQLS